MSCSSWKVVLPYLALIVCPNKVYLNWKMVTNYSLNLKAPSVLRELSHNVQYGNDFHTPFFTLCVRFCFSSP